MRKYYTETGKGVRCIRCRDHFPSNRELAAHYASDGRCRIIIPALDTKAA